MSRNVNVSSSFCFDQITAGSEAELFSLQNPGTNSAADRVAFCAND